MKIFKKILSLCFSIVICFFCVQSSSACGIPIYDFYKCDDSIVLWYNKNGVTYDERVNDVRFFDQFRYDDANLIIKKSKSLVFNLFGEEIKGKCVIQQKPGCFSGSEVFFKFNNGVTVKPIRNGNYGTTIKYNDYELCLQIHSYSKKLDFIEENINKNYSLEKLLNRQSEILDECIENKDIVAINEEAFYNKKNIELMQERTTYRYRTGMLYEENGERFFVFDDGEIEHYITSNWYPNFYNYINGEITLYEYDGKLGRCILQYPTYLGINDFDYEYLIFDLNSTALYFY